MAYLLHISPVDDVSYSAAPPNVLNHLPRPTLAALTSSMTSLSSTVLISKPALVTVLCSVAALSPTPVPQELSVHYEALDILDQAKSPDGVMVNRDNQLNLPMLSISTFNEAEWIQVVQTYQIRITSRFPSCVRANKFDLTAHLLDHFKLYKPIRAYQDSVNFEWLVEFTDRVARNTAIKWRNGEPFEILIPFRMRIDHLQLVSEHSPMVLPKRGHMRRGLCVDLASELTGMLLTAASVQVRRNHIDVALAAVVDRWLKQEGEKRVAAEDEKRRAREEKGNFLRITPESKNLAAITRRPVVTNPWLDQDDEVDADADPDQTQACSTSLNGPIAPGSSMDMDTSHTQLPQESSESSSEVCVTNISSMSAVFLFEIYPLPVFRNSSCFIGLQPKQPHSFAQSQITNQS